MQTEWEPDELIETWILTGDDWDLVCNKSGATRLGFAALLKFYQVEGRFPAYREEVPPAVVRYLGSLVKVDPALYAKYPWTGRSIAYHKAQVRRVYGTRPPTEDDEERWARWLAEEICPAETSRDRLAAALRRRCRSEKVEPPAPGQVERVVASGCRQFDDAFAAVTAARLGPLACGRLQDLLTRPGVLADLKSDPGPLGLDTLLAEIGKLSTVRALGLDESVFAGASDRIVAAWRARAARMYPSDFAECGEPVRYTLLAALCWTRQAELVDGLVELLIGLIHRINARAERRVEKELIGEVTNVQGKRGIYTKMIDAALDHPDDAVRDAVYPAVPGGVKTLTALARELKATERAVAERVRYQLRGSYSHYYRRMLAPLLAALEFRCNNSAYRPVMDAIGLLARYTGTDSDQKLYAAGEKVPVDGVVGWPAPSVPVLTVPLRSPAPPPRRLRPARGAGPCGLNPRRRTCGRRGYRAVPGAPAARSRPDAPETTHAAALGGTPSPRCARGARSARLCAGSPGLLADGGRGGHRRAGRGPAVREARQDASPGQRVAEDAEHHAAAGVGFAAVQPPGVAQHYSLARPEVQRGGMRGDGDAQRGDRAGGVG